MNAASAPVGAAALPPAWRMGARWSYGVIGFYAALALLLTYLGTLRPHEAWLSELLIAALAIYLARYLSTHYRLDARRLVAGRLFGSRRIDLTEIRQAEPISLRDLAPVGLVGSWGWRGRMWSPRIGSFDTVHTVSEGILVTGGTGVPLFISPKDPSAFLEELSRRVRSYHPDFDRPEPPA